MRIWMKMNFSVYSVYRLAIYAWIGQVFIIKTLTFSIISSLKLTDYSNERNFIFQSIISLGYKKNTKSQKNQQEGEILHLFSDKNSVT